MRASFIFKNAQRGFLDVRNIQPDLEFLIGYTTIPPEGTTQKTETTTTALPGK